MFVIFGNLQLKSKINSFYLQIKFQFFEHLKTVLIVKFVKLSLMFIFGKKRRKSGAILYKKQVSSSQWVKVQCCKNVARSKLQCTWKFVTVLFLYRFLWCLETGIVLVLVHLRWPKCFVVNCFIASENCYVKQPPADSLPIKLHGRLSSQVCGTILSDDN